MSKLIKNNVGNYVLLTNDGKRMLDGPFKEHELTAELIANTLLGDSSCLHTAKEYTTP